MKRCFVMIALSLLALKLSAAETNSPPLLKIGANEAGKFYGREMVVTGKVAQVTIRPKIVFLNLDKPYPDSPLALVIFPAQTNQFGNLKALKGHDVEATGKIQNFHNKPEIVLESGKQLKIK